MPWRRLAIALAALGLTGCGAHRATVTVAVTNHDGRPIRGVDVRLVGTRHNDTSDASGNAAIHGVKPGIYDVRAGKLGYVQGEATVTVAKGSDPEPESIALAYRPPLGTFVYHPKSTEWLVLDIAGGDPVQVTLRTIEWGCWVQTWDHHDDQPLKLDEEKNELHGHQSIEIIGPNSLDPSWRRLTAGTLPDTSVDAEPKGACNGSVAAWDHSH